MERSYIYAGAQPVAFYEGDYTDPAYIYLHDRLSSVRLLIDESSDVENVYTYQPYGQLIATESAVTVDNPFMFTGQWYDDEIDQYYLRARQYEPELMRLTSIDPVKGKPYQPQTLHAYLYCANEPINQTDPSGKVYLNVANGLIAATSVYSAGLSIAVYGAKTENFDLIIAGAYVMELSPLAYAFGLGFGDKVVTVTRWGAPGTGQGWVMAGRKNYLNYLLSGKWLGTKSNQFAAYSTGHSWKVLASELGLPPGREWIKLFIGQCMYTP